MGVCDSKKDGQRDRSASAPVAQTQDADERKGDSHSTGSLPGLSTASSTQMLKGTSNSSLAGQGLSRTGSVELKGGSNSSSRLLSEKRKSRAERKQKKELGDGLSLEDALKLGPPPMQEQVEEVVELLEELLEDLASDNLQLRKVKSRLNEATYIMTHLKIPEEALENRAERLAKQIANSSSNVATGDSEVQLWMKRSFGAHADAPKKKVELKEIGSVMEALVGKTLTETEELRKQRLQARLQRVLAINRAREKNNRGSGADGGLHPEDWQAVVAGLSPLQSVELELSGFTPRFVLRACGFWSFDIFRFANATHHRPLSCIMMHLFWQLDLFSFCNLKPETLACWLTKVEQGYKDNPYHNRVHAADVVQNTFYLLTGSPIKDQLDKVHWFSALLAAAIHDLEHPGLTNPFLVLTRHPLAIRYNDQSILENMHCARAFQLMKEEGCDIFAGLKASDRQKARKIMVDMVLHTDMKHHFGMLASIQYSISNEKAMVEANKKPGGDKPKKFAVFDNVTPEEMSLLLKVILHVADLGNPAKPEEIMTVWTARITEEFFRQGDAERKLGLNISPMMDRQKPNIPNSQVGFIDVIVAPLFKTWAGAAPMCMEIPLKYMEANRTFWQEMTKAPSALRLPGVDSFHAGRAGPTLTKHLNKMKIKHRFAEDDSDEDIAVS
eukprot:gb/GEZN01002480.1/.p1 GENE.gb/GEZN01002480.1/~~gb/GEZN01002480.1/.p1  ORF type:complete len:670 (+),score=131.27 gb/GEZN01002480.1/:347-2356(+)